MLPFLLCLAGAATSAVASALAPRGDSFVWAQITAHEGISAPSRAKRQGNPDPVEVTRAIAGLTYTIDIGIGTPPQNITVIIDTGSSDLWVNPTCTASNNLAVCASLPEFDYLYSSTFTETGPMEQLSYMKGSALIEFVTDDITIGSGTIKNQIFGVNVQSTYIPISMMGLMPSYTGTDPYSYVLDSLASQGVIQSRAFSLDLRDAGDPSGAIIFGGVDVGKFVGALQKCPMLDASQTPGNMVGYWITLTGIGITTPAGTSELATGLQVPVNLDSGTTLSSLPTAIYWALGEDFPGAQYDPTSASFVVDCDIANQPGSVDFVFNGKTISVAYLDFIYDIGSQCILGMVPTDNTPILGDTFLRSAYVVYDEDNKNVHVAQAANCGTSIIAISTGTDAVPSATGLCSISLSATVPVVSTTTIDVSTSVSPTVLYTGNPIPTSSLDLPGPQVSQVSLAGSTSIPISNVTGAPTLSAPGSGATTTSTTTTSGGVGSVVGRGGPGSLAAVGLVTVVVAAWLFG